MPTYSPPWCPHVVGEYPERTFEESDEVPGVKKLIPMKIVMTCNACGATHQHTCETGAVHQWVQRFALVHLHRDPMRAGPQQGNR